MNCLERRDQGTKELKMPIKSIYMTILVALLTNFAFGHAAGVEFATSRNFVGISKVSSLEFDTPVGDVAPLGELIGTSRIVALGEANHTNGSFHKAMARLAKYLVESKSFRVILIETPRLPARTLDLYIHDCSKGADPVEGLNLIFPQFASVELEQLYFWLRGFNCTHLNDQVSLAGFDVQQGWNYADPQSFDVVVLADFVNSGASSLKSRLAELRRCGPGPNSNGTGGPSNLGELDQCLQFLTALDPFIRKSGTKANELEASAIALRYSAAQWLAIVQNDSLAQNTVRDAGMAQMTEHLLLGQYRERKAVLIAHEGHVARNFQEFSPFTKKNMGTFLGDFFKSNYFVAATISYQPAKAEWWTGGDALPVFPKKSTEGILFDSGIGNLILSTHHNGLFKPTDTFEPGMAKQAVMKRFVDAFVFIPTSQAMTNIPGVTTYSK
jgi:erythromycin esterase-like protein